MQELIKCHYSKLRTNYKTGYINYDAIDYGFTLTTSAQLSLMSLVKKYNAKLVTLGFTSGMILRVIRGSPQTKREFIDSFIKVLQDDHSWHTLGFTELNVEIQDNVFQRAEYWRNVLGGMTRSKAYTEALHMWANSLSSSYPDLAKGGGEIAFINHPQIINDSKGRFIPAVESLIKEIPRTKYKKWICKKCGHVWVNRKPKPPSVCPKCKVYTWNKEGEPK